jgi:hypothetical protein
MLRLLSDESLRAAIVRGLLLQRPTLDLITVHAAGLRTAADPEILDWAAAENRIVVTHDRATMPTFAFERIVAGFRMPGMFVLPQSISISESIEEILLLNECTEQQEWDGKVVYLPM